MEQFGWSRATTSAAISLQRTETGVISPFVKDEAKRQMVAKGLFIAILAGLGTAAGVGAYKAMKGAKIASGAASGLKAALKGRDIANIGAGPSTLDLITSATQVYSNIKPILVSRKSNSLYRIKTGMANTTGGSINWDKKKNEISGFLIGPNL